MIKLHLITGCRNITDTASKLSIISSSLQIKRHSSGSSKNVDSSVKEEQETESQRKSNETRKKLHELLNQMIQNPKDDPRPTLELAKPKIRNRLLQPPNEETKQKQSFEQQISIAAKDVAQKIGGDEKQTESELLSKLLHSKTDTATALSSLSDIVKGMKIDRESKAPEPASRADQVRQLLDFTRGNQQRVVHSHPRAAESTAERLLIDADNRNDSQVTMEKIDLFGSKPLGIFTANKDCLKDEGIPNKTWEILQQRELRLAVTHPPSNYFEQMIQWTEQGKVWKFPIDNEQGMEEEKSTYFTEHVFLEKHLEPWCPQKGPVRHFMELVCVGLSKNPYMTVQTKKDHIEWYKDYFVSKLQLLREVGAIPAENVTEASKTELP